MLQSDGVQQISKKEKMLALHNECKCFLIINTKDWAGLVPRMTGLSWLFVSY